MNRACAVFLGCTLAACGAPETTEPENPTRAALETAIAELDPQVLLHVRYNPAACACPPVEVRVGAQWLRAELTGGAADPWLASLVKTSPENLPVPLQILGRIERDVLRTAQGSYAVRVEVLKMPASAAPVAPKRAP